MVTASNALFTCAEAISSLVMTFESCRPAVVEGGAQDNSNVATRLRKNSVRMIHLQTFQGQRAMSWAADFGTLHKMSGMDQAGVIDHVRPTGVSGSPNLGVLHPSILSRPNVIFVAANT